MPDILIKGMEMPSQGCCFCYFRVGNFCRLLPDVSEEIIIFARQEIRHPNCPLVEVMPHGRLIDADAYELRLQSLGDREYRREKGTICDAIKFLHPYYAPTIIPASEGVSNGT